MTEAGLDLGLIAAGAISSAVNVVAGGGSLLTLACLMAMGQTAGSANATVRLGILLQNIISLWLFHREGHSWIPSRPCASPPSSPSVEWLEAY